MTPPQGASPGIREHARRHTRESRPDARRVYLITCEHGGNRIPAEYLDLFTGWGALRRTHRGYDAGALRMARDLSRALSAPLLVSTISRLLIDLNRSPGHPKLYSDASRAAPAALRREIFTRHYLPYREDAEALITRAIEDGAQVVHISSHSFTPELEGKVRNADIGLLYDPARAGEAELCRRWKAALRHHAPHMNTRLNYPYAGTSDGFTVYLRKRFPAERYIGIELEINQKHVRGHGAHWRALRRAILSSFLDAAGPARPATGN
ncbi:MAG TPA: N-formylglutamate amidohydrolase [Noviherbaspirillum sp.]